MAVPCGSRYWTAAPGRPKAAGPGFPGPQDSAQAAAGSELEVEVQVVLAAVGIERVRQLRVVAGLAVVLELGIVEVERVEGDRQPVGGLEPDRGRDVADAVLEEVVGARHAGVELRAVGVADPRVEAVVLE